MSVALAFSAELSAWPVKEATRPTSLQSLPSFQGAIEISGGNAEEDFQPSVHANVKKEEKGSWALSNKASEGSEMKHSVGNPDPLLLPFSFPFKAHVSFSIPTCHCYHHLHQPFHQLACIKPFHSRMATLEPLEAASSEGLRNRVKQTSRSDSPRSDSTETASPSSQKDHDDKKDAEGSDQQPKVLGRTPDGTGKCHFLRSSPHSADACVLNHGRRCAAA